MTTSTTADRIRLQDMREIIERAMHPGDYTHSTTWIDGHAAEVPTPAAHIMTAGILISALPGPGPDGTVGTEEAALSVLHVITERLAPFPYTLRAHSLVRRLTEESEQYELAHAAPGAVAVTPGSAARCMVCSAPLKAGSKSTRKTCGDNCRAALMRSRRRSRQSPATVKPLQSGEPGTHPVIVVCG